MAKTCMYKGQEAPDKGHPADRALLGMKWRGQYYVDLNQTDCGADTTAKGFIWANISTSTTSLLQGQSYKLECFSGPEED